MKKVLIKINYTLFFLTSLTMLIYSRIMMVLIDAFLAKVFNINTILSIILSFFTLYYILYIIFRKETDDNLSIMCLFHNIALVMCLLYGIFIMNVNNSFLFFIEPMVYYNVIIFSIIYFFTGIYSITKLISYKKEHKVFDKKTFKIFIISLVICALIIIFFWLFVYQNIFGTYTSIK